MMLMLLGNGVIVMAVSSIIPVVLQAGAETATFAGTLVQVVGLASGLALLWMLAVSKWVDHHLSRLIGWALTHFTHIELQDFHSLLHLSEGYSVTELQVFADDWVAGKSLMELRLTAEGIQVLGIHRQDGEFLGTPTGTTIIHPGDTLLVYGQGQDAEELKSRPAGQEGDEAHRRRAKEQQHAIAEQERQDLMEVSRKGAQLPDYHSLLRLVSGYNVTEMRVGEGHWMAGKRLIDLRLGDEGIQILGVRRVSGDFIATPAGGICVLQDDTLIAYGQMENIAELQGRPAGPDGDAAHEKQVREQRLSAEEQERREQRLAKTDENGTDATGH